MKRTRLPLRCYVRGFQREERMLAREIQGGHWYAKTMESGSSLETPAGATAARSQTIMGFTHEWHFLRTGSSMWLLILTFNPRERIAQVEVQLCLCSTVTHVRTHFKSKRHVSSIMCILLVRCPTNSCSTVLWNHNPWNKAQVENVLMAMFLSWRKLGMDLRENKENKVWRGELAYCAKKD